MLLERARQAEFAALLALCFFLPLYEAPKNLAWAAYVLVWLANRAAARDFGGRWDGWDALLAAWIASGFAVAAFAGLKGGEWRGALDLLRYGSVLWLVRRSRFGERELRRLLTTLIASTVLGLTLGYVHMLTGETERLELNSVGHVNHTAIYLAMVFGLCAAWFFTTGSVVAAAAAFMVLASLFMTESRAGLGAALASLLVLGAAWWRRARWPAGAAAFVLAATAALALAGGAGIFEKQKAQLAKGDVLNLRARVWQIAIDTWERHPWFGVGMDNFVLVTRGEEEPYRSLYPHAHSLYLNTLAERGVVGAAALGAVLIGLLAALVRRPAADDSGERWMLWGSAAGAWIVTCVAGTVNTTLHGEHGLLAALLFGLWLGHFPRR